VIAVVRYMEVVAEEGRQTLRSPPACFGWLSRDGRLDTASLRAWFGL
jgi:hypothetical protein